MTTPSAIRHTSTLTVDDHNTAMAIGSGDLPVLATPALVALMENAAMLAARQLLSEGETTVGGHIDVKHLKPSPIGATISAEATLESRTDKQLTFKIVAKQSDLIVGEAVHTRFIVNSSRFMERIPSPV